MLTCLFKKKNIYIYIYKLVAFLLKMFELTEEHWDVVNVPKERANPGLRGTAALHIQTLNPRTEVPRTRVDADVPICLFFCFFFTVLLFTVTTLVLS